MDIEAVRQRVEDIRAMTGDPEAAHSTEDELLVEVLEAIAAGTENAPELASEALTVCAVSFPRWYA